MSTSNNPETRSSAKNLIIFSIHEDWLDKFSIAICSWIFRKYGILRSKKVFPTMAFAVDAILKSYNTIFIVLVFVKFHGMQGVGNSTTKKNMCARNPDLISLQKKSQNIRPQNREL
jgi:hypothetical protein